MKNLSIRGQVVILVLSVVIPLVGVGAYGAYTEFRFSAERAEESALSLAEVTSANIQAFLDDALAMLLDVARRPEVRAMDSERCDPLLTELLYFLPQYTNLFVTDATTQLVCSGLEGPPRTGPANSPDMTRALTIDTPGEYLLARPSVGRLSGRWNSALILPIWNDEETAIIGLAGVGLDLLRFHGILRSPNLAPGAVITIDDLAGTVVARSTNPELWLGETLPSSNNPPELLTQPRGITFGPGVDGIDRVWGFSRVPGSNWRVWAGIPIDHIYEPVRTAMVGRLLVLLGALALVTVLTTVIYGRISASLRDLVNRTQAAAEGTEIDTPLVGPREVVEVAQHFARTLDARIRAEERYRSVVRNAAFGIALATPEGVLEDGNPALATLLGVASPEALCGISLADRFPSSQDRDHLLGLMASGAVLSGEETEWRRDDGKVVQARIYGHPIQDQEGHERYELFVEDVTERKLLEEQFLHAQKMEAVGRLAGGVAHDFNNLLTVITHEAHELAFSFPEGDVRRDSAEQILASSDRGAELTRQLLAFSRKQVLRPRLVDLNEVVVDSRVMLQRLMQDHGLLRIIPSSDPTWVRVDPIQIQQILMNLVVNARDAVENDGVVEIMVETAVVHPENAPAGSERLPGTYAILSVSDNGSGIPEEFQRRIFEPFFTTKPLGSGTGLGLATVFGIARQSGGDVEFSTSPEAGTTFTVYLPLRQAPESAVDATPVEAG